jgi:hypothetical protein
VNKCACSANIRNIFVLKLIQSYEFYFCHNICLYKTPVVNLQPVSTTPALLVAIFATSAVDTCGKFAAGVADTGGKFATGVVDTGGAS